MGKKIRGQGAKAWYEVKVMAVLVVTLAVSVIAVQKNQNVNSRAMEPKLNISVTTDKKDFPVNKSVTVDFSLVKVSKILTDDYQNFGILFTSLVTSGWATYQANEFLNNLSTVPTLPGAPAGSTGTKMAFTAPVGRFGILFSAGSPLARSWQAPAKRMEFRLYDQNGIQVFTHQTDTCLGLADKCYAQFLGFKANKKAIKSVEMIILDPYSWSWDDLVYLP